MWLVSAARDSSRYQRVEHGCISCGNVPVHIILYMCALELFRGLRVCVGVVEVAAIHVVPFSNVGQGAFQILSR